MPRVSMTAQMMRDDEHYQHYKIDTRKKIKFFIDIFILKLLSIKYFLSIVHIHLKTDYHHLFSVFLNIFTTKLTFNDFPSSIRLWDSNITFIYKITQI